MRKVIVEKAERLEKIPPYPLFDINRTLKRLDKKGVEIIDLGRFDPAFSLPDSIQKVLSSLYTKENFSYAEASEVLKLKEIFSVLVQKKIWDSVKS